MDSAQRLPVKEEPGLPLLLSRDTVATILRESAWNALARAFLVQILVSIAVGFLGGIFREMSPSAPPGFSHGPTSSSGVWHGVGTFVTKNEFWIIFAVLFCIITATRFAHFLRQPKHRKLAAWFLWVHRRISCHWFSLFVTNGITAFIWATIIVAMQQFSWARMFWSVISAMLQPFFQMLAGLIPGEAILERWFSWYAYNQPKFLFWLLYSAAICDDLGLPNYKALIRWGRRRLKRWFWGRSGEEESLGAPASRRRVWLRQRNWPARRRRSQGPPL
jgi:hypothetical protein